MADLEGRMRPIERLAHGGDFLGPERRAMGDREALFRRCAEADARPRRDQGRPIGGPGGRQCRVDGADVVAMDGDRVPAGRLEPTALVVGGADAGRAVDRCAVVVEDDRELAESEMAGERDRFLTDAFHQAAVAAEDPGAMIDEIVAEFGIKHALRQRHADGGGDTLAERPCGRLDRGEMAVFRVPGGERPCLAEFLQFGERDVDVSGQVQQAVEEHRSVTVRQHEAIAIRPARVCSVEPQMTAEQSGGEVRHAERHARMPGPRLFHGINGEEPQGRCHFPEIALRSRHIHHVAAPI
jgi:hypothetical protein